MAVNTVINDTNINDVFLGLTTEDICDGWNISFSFTTLRVAEFTVRGIDQTGNVGYNDQTYTLPTLVPISDTDELSVFIRTICA